MDHPYADRFWTSDDGLKLHYRDYPGDEGKVPVLCLHGLTRNARDFAGLADDLAGGRRVIVPDFRGRGTSAYAEDAGSYQPLRYTQDVEQLLEAQGIDRVAAIGTSLGGLVTMFLAQRNPGLMAGAVLNDIGPELEPAGLEAIRGYVGQGRSFPTWMHAARALRELHGGSHPTFETEDWLAMAKRTMVLLQNGRISYDYDMAIAEPFRDTNEAEGDQPDLWPAFDALGDIPLLLVRGGLSNLLSADTAAAMARRNPRLDVVTVPDVGHAPLLDEAEARAAIDPWVAQVP
ncbi:alpha/beta hydrolase [Erythrobacter sp. LQ02-29]|uniref:alpha/beta fold hydrolase n=1 Tax=Erythrobacter sp. LQ02-29 TaxID=2920384 RepID=UPI001F4E5034|nr:alpha/beta hydrolase [Erythrobacter sp. LQ02-29]MCP9223735.1 alpha/beta hydrolase [Erythrobacter sp. LQ02-29]